MDHFLYKISKFSNNHFHTFNLFDFFETEEIENPKNFKLDADYGLAQEKVVKIQLKRIFVLLTVLMSE